MKHNYFNFAFLTILFLILTSCSSDDENVEPQLSFTIENGERVAPAEINITNNTTDFNGDYIWEVEWTTMMAIETYETEDLSFTANKSGEYIIRLKTANGDYLTEQSLEIERPSALLLNKITLTEIPQSYDALYFKIKKINLDWTTSYVYTSQPRQNISTMVSFGDYYWNIDVPFNHFNIPYENSEVGTYIIEFYNEDDALVTKMNAFSTMFSEYSSFETRTETITTTSVNCQTCHYFEIEAEFDFSNN